MSEAAQIILLHQLLFQGLFFAKNLTLRLKLGEPIRGDNPEARRAVLFFVAFIAISLYFGTADQQFAEIRLLPGPVATGLCLLLLGFNLVFGLSSLKDLGGSWRVGVIEEQSTELVEDGIYRFTRNPYFVSYLMMFGAYTLLLQNLLLFALSFVGFGFIHGMILKEEAYLETVHGKSYRDYKQRVPRYLLL